MLKEKKLENAPFANSCYPLGDRELWSSIHNYDMWFVEERLRRDSLIAESHILAAISRFKNFIFLVASGYSHLEMPLSDVDAVWHAFILFTEEYAAFCTRYVGSFVHHAPITSRSIRSVAAEDGFFRAYKAVFGEDLHDVDRDTNRSKCSTCRARDSRASESAIYVA